MTERTAGAVAGPERNLDAARPMLSVTGISKRFGGVLALSGVDLALAPASMTGLIGPNGAGKSTLFNVMTGVVPPDRGTIVVDGADVTGWQMSQVARAGVARTFQTPRGFTSMTVRDNLVLAPSMRQEGFLRAFAPWGAARRRAIAEAEEVLERIGLTHVGSQLYPQLSAGQMRLLEIGRHLMRQPKVLMLDEPTAGTTPEMQDRLRSLLMELNADGMTVLIVEHNLGFVLPLVSMLFVMDGGRVIASGPPAQVQRDPAVTRAYLGEAK